MKPKLLVLTLSMLLFILFSCAKEEHLLESKINKALNSNNNIDKNEYDEILSYVIQNKRELKGCKPGIVINDTIHPGNLNKLLNKIANERRNKTEYQIYDPRNKESDSENNPPKINVYFENSGSMHGYINGNTDFEAAILDLLVEIDYFYNDLYLYYINTDTFPIQKEIDAFIRELEPDEVSKYGTKSQRGSSNLNQIIDILLSNINNNEISILISDFIYSIRDGNTESLLNHEKSLTKRAYLKASRHIPLSTDIIKLVSNFNGTYYTKNNVMVILTDHIRPYYLWIIGNPILLNEFRKKIDYHELQGFSNFISFSSNATYNDIYWTILHSTGKSGYFKPNRLKSSKDYTHGIIDCQPLRKKKNFTFCVALDMNSIPTDKKYIMDLSHYSVSSGFRIKKIEQVSLNSLEKRDYLRVKGRATHFIELEAEDFSITSEDLILQLKTKIPKWVYETTILDDRDISLIQDKTFGFKYLVEGVSDAYKTIEQAPDYYFCLEISIKK